MDHNWSGNVDLSAATFHQPRTVAEAQRIVAASGAVRAVGAGHTFNQLVVTGGDLISLEHLPRRVEVAADRTTVTVDAGIRYGELAPALDAEGLALANMASLPFFTVVGACATGTHGSGDTNRGLAAAVRGLELITASGDLGIVDDGDDPDTVAAMAVGLGAFGLVTSLTLAVEPRYEMAQTIDVDVPLGATIDRLDEVMASAYSVSLFTNWLGDSIHSLWRKYRLDELQAPRPEVLELGGTSATAPLVDYHTAAAMAPGPWYERLPHVRWDRPDAPRPQLQSEWFVARRHGPDALRAMVALGPRVAPAMTGGVLAEIRSVAADDPWLSPFAEDTLALHFSWASDPGLCAPVIPLIEEALTPFEPRPHWGKLYTMAAEDIRSRYPRFDDWARLVAAYDPTGTFANDHVRALLG
jgi:xylitol oxidase